MRQAAGLAGLALLAAAGPAAGQRREPWQPPTLTVTRYDEDWSGLADPAARSGRWTEAWKAIPLGEATLTAGLELRARHESFRNNDWGAAEAPDDGYLWLRALPYADLRAGRVRAFVQPIAAWARGVRPSAGPTDRTGVDLLQGFVEADGAVGRLRTRLRAGRQLMPLGSERLVGARYGPNVPLAFDGGRADLILGPRTVSLFDVTPVRAGPGDFDDGPISGRRLWGIYSASPGLELYYLGYRRRDATFGGRTGPERRESFGVRSFGHAGPWRWNVEAVGQTGRFDRQRIRAWTLASEVARRLPEAPLRPDLMLRANVASGDRSADDRRLGTFNALFPKGKYFGELSPVGPYNILSLNPSAAFDVGAGVTVTVSGMAYWRQSLADGVYDIPGRQIRAAGVSRVRAIGRQVEVAIDWQATPELELSASASAFRPGGFLRETGPARTRGLVGLEANFRF